MNEWIYSTTIRAHRGREILQRCAADSGGLRRAREQVAHHMSVAMEMGVWLTISGATYSGVPYMQ